MSKFSKLFLVAGIAIASFGQTARAADYFKLGAMIGLTDTFSNLSNSAAAVSPNTSSKVGLGLGAMIEFPIAPVVRLEIDALLVNQGYSVGAVSTSFKYLQIPAIIRVTAIPIVNFGAGMYYANAIGSISYDSGTGISADTDYTSLTYQKSDFGIVLAAGADFSVAPLLTVFADVRYQIGLANVYDSALAPSSNLKFNVLSIYGGLKVGL